MVRSKKIRPRIKQIPRQQMTPHQLKSYRPHLHRTNRTLKHQFEPPPAQQRQQQPSPHSSRCGTWIYSWCHVWCGSSHRHSRSAGHRGKGWWERHSSGPNYRDRVSNLILKCYSELSARRINCKRTEEKRWAYEVAKAGIAKAQRAKMIAINDFIMKVGFFLRNRGNWFGLRWSFVILVAVMKMM